MWYCYDFSQSDSIYDDFTSKSTRCYYSMVILYTYHTFTALVLDGIIQQHEGSVGYTLNVPFIIALIPTVLLAIYTRSLTWTILGGIAFIALLRFFL